MKAFFKNKVVLIVAAVIVTAGLITGGILIGNSIKNKNNPANSTASSTESDGNDKYYEVKFANLEGTDEAEAERTRLPETAMVTEGTKISALTTPQQAEQRVPGLVLRRSGHKACGRG